LFTFADAANVTNMSADPKAPKSMDEPNPPDNVVSLGTESMFAIADELRRMYASYLRQEPPERLAQLMRRIERGEDIP
jgi:hypothetical protein